MSGPDDPFAAAGDGAEPTSARVREEAVGREMARVRFAFHASLLVIFVGAIAAGIVVHRCLGTWVPVLADRPRLVLTLAIGAGVLFHLLAFLPVRFLYRRLLAILALRRAGLRHSGRHRRI